LKAKLAHKPGIGEGSRQLTIRVEIVVVQVAVVEVTGVAPPLDVGVLRGGREGGREGGRAGEREGGREGEESLMTRKVQMNEKKQQ
jgi:hypothetical protein